MFKISIKKDIKNATVIFVLEDTETKRACAIPLKEDFKLTELEETLNKMFKLHKTDEEKSVNEKE